MFGFRVHLILFIYLFYLIFCADSENPRKIFCADSACSEVISEAQGKLLYNPGEKNVLSFRKGAKVMIYGKSKEKNGYWLGRIGNNFGFVPSPHLKEITVWKDSKMLKYEVPLSIENNKIYLKPNENDNSHEENAGTEPLRDTNLNTLDTLNGLGSSSLSNLVRGNISTLSNEPLQEQVKNEPQAQSTDVPELNVKPTKTNSDTVQTTLPLNVINESSGNVHQNDVQTPNEELNFAETTSDEKLQESSANDVSEKSEVLTVLNQSSKPDQLNPEKSEGIINSGGNLGSKASDKEESVDTAQTSGVNPAASHEELSNVQNINEKLGENMRGNVVGSTDIYNSSEDLREMSTSSSASMSRNDTENISISSTGSSGGISSSRSSNSSSNGDSATNDDESSEKSSSNGISNNLQTSDLTHKNSLSVKNVEYTLASEVYETTVLPVRDEITQFNTPENENENLNLLQNIPPIGSTSSEGNVGQQNIPPSPNQNTIEENLNETMVETVNANTNPREGSSRISISTNEDSSSASSSSSSVSSTGSVAASNNDMNDKKTPNDNTKSSDVAAEPLPKENTATYQNTEQFQTGTHILGSLDGISAWVVEGRTPTVETVEGSIDSAPVNQESLTVQSGEGQPGLFNAETYATRETLLFTTSDILAPTKTISSQGDATEKYKVGGAGEEAAEKFDHELPVEQYGSSVDGTVQNVEDDVSEGTVPDHVGNTVQENLLDINFSAENTGEGEFFSNLGNSLLTWIGLGDKTEDDETDMKRDEIINDDFMKEFSTEKLSQENAVSLEGNCRAGPDSYVNCEDTPLEGSSKMGFWNIWTESKNLNISSSNKTLMYLIVTAVTVLLFTLGYYFIEKTHSDGPLIVKLNKLEQELLISSKECLILKDELANTKEKLNLFETSSNDKIIAALQQELEDLKKAKSVLENNVEILQQELDAATEAGLDLNRMLSEVLTQNGGSETLMKSVENLQSQLNDQQKIIDEMTTKLVDKTKENQELKDELSAAEEKIEGLENEMEDMRGNLNVHLKDNEDIIRDLTSKNHELQMKINKLNEAKEKEISKLKKLVAELENSVKSASDSLKIKVEECNNLKESFKKIKMKDNKNIDSLFEASRVKAELVQSANENTSLKERLNVEGDKLVKLENKIKILEEEMEKLKLKSDEAVKEKLEAQTRLEVLSNYFKEKETQLQKELGLKEAMWVQKQGDDSTIYERIKSLEEEISSYKSQNETLKKEILDQERSLKAQIATLEKKAHDNWIAARQAERKLEESKQEGAQLRNRLTLLDKSISNDLETNQHHRAGEEVNGGDSLSPLIHDTSSPLLFPHPLPLDPNNTALMPPGFIPPPLFMPPPPGGFMPPPPPFLPGDHRPPPLGRMSSPPLNNRFSPPPVVDYAYDRISTPPMSPSSRNYRSQNESDRERFRHRTPTSPSFRSRNWQESPTAGMSSFRPIASERDSRREHKGGSNLSSGHSSDSLDKSSRHSGRV